MHGAGTAGHRNFTDQAQSLASAGVYVLVPAKRMDTYTLRHRDYPQMADDYMHSLEELRQWPGVDPDRVGIYGESEGAYIAAVAAADYEEVAFTVLVSAPVVPPREQAAYASDAYLRAVGAPAALLRAIPRAIGVSIPGGGFEYADFDVQPYQERLEVPILMVYGTEDLSMPVVQGASQVVEDVATNGNNQVTVRYYDGANHGIRSNGDLVEGFTRDMARWTLGLPQTARAEPQVAGAQPEQRYVAAPVAGPRWYADGDWLLYTLLGSFGLVLAGPAIWAVGKAVRRPTEPTMPPPLARYSAAVGLGAVAALVIFAAYLVQVAQYALNYLTNDVVVVGGYVLVLGVGVLAAWVLYSSLEAAGTALGSTEWSSLGRVIWSVTHLGAVCLLLIAAYWGVFPSFI